MKVSETTTVTTKTKMTLKKRIEAEISIHKFERAMTVQEATVVAEALAEELAVTGVYVVRIRRILQEHRTIFAIHFIQMADAVRMAMHVQKTRHNSLFAA